MGRSKWIVKTLFILLVATVVTGTLLVSSVFWFFSRNLPQLITVADYRPAIVSQLILRDPEGEQVVGEFFKEKRYIVPVEKIPKKLVDAFISAEDDQFFSHQGINIISIIRAAIANFRAGQVVQGGSTITQQVAKSLLLTPERSFVRKAKELLLAAQIESNLTKNEILYLYLNQIYLGHGAYGVEAAARIYYNKSLSDLTLAEMAVIAGMPQAPGKYSPHLNPRKAKERQLYVLRRMRDSQRITQADYEQAIKEPLKVYEPKDINLDISPYWAEHVRRYLLSQYGEEKLYTQGLRVYIDGRKETLVTAGKALRSGLRDLDRRGGYRPVSKILSKPADRQTFLEQSRLNILRTYLGYEILDASGVLSFEKSLSMLPDQSLSGLVPVGTTVKSLITAVNDKASSIQTDVGNEIIEISKEGLDWALQGRHAPSLFKIGQVVEIRKIADKKWEIDQTPESQAALLSIDLETGLVLAMEGGQYYQQSQFNRATQAQRQMGSAFKPFIFAAALENGFTPASVIVDAPIVYSDEEFGKWKPANHEEKFYGDTLFRQALVKSRNIPAIKVVQEIQVSKLIAFAERIGFRANFARDLSIALGTTAVPLLEITEAYAVFPRLGRKLEARFFTEVRDRNGVLLEETKPSSPVPAQFPWLTKNTPDTKDHSTDYPLADDPDQVVDPRVAFVTTHLMQEVVSFGTGQEAKQLGRSSAGKTGTTNDYQDAWYMGFTPKVITGVWVGYDQARVLGSGETGARAALPIWLQFMKEVTRTQPKAEFRIPPGVVFTTIHSQTGKKVDPHHPMAVREAFIEGTEPQDGQSLPTESKDNPSTADFLKEDIE